MREHSALLLVLFRTAYIHTMIIYSACLALHISGALVGLAATTLLAIGSEISFVYRKTEGPRYGKELRYMV